MNLQKIRRILNITFSNQARVRIRNAHFEITGTVNQKQIDALISHCRKNDINYYLEDGKLILKHDF